MKEGRYQSFVPTSPAHDLEYGTPGTPRLLECQGILRYSQKSLQRYLNLHEVAI